MRPYYEDAAVTIYHGDCREILPTLGQVDLVLTDPPYGIGFPAQPTKWQRRNGHMPVEWDNHTADSALAQAMECGDDQVVWGGQYYSLGFARTWLAWVKPDAPPSMGSLEMAWTSLSVPSRHIVCSIGETNAERVGHPTQKPLKVIRWTLQFFPAATTILDPFMGSGTTLRAAKDLGRKAIGIEIEEQYCEIAAQRMSQMVLAFEAD